MPDNKFVLNVFPAGPALSIYYPQEQIVKNNNMFISDGPERRPFLTAHYTRLHLAISRLCKDKYNNSSIYGTYTYKNTVDDLYLTVLDCIASKEKPKTWQILRYSEYGAGHNIGTIKLPAGPAPFPLLKEVETMVEEQPIDVVRKQFFDHLRSLTANVANKSEMKKRKKAARLVMRALRRAPRLAKKGYDSSVILSRRQFIISSQQDAKELIMHDPLYKYIIEFIKSEKIPIGIKLVHNISRYDISRHDEAQIVIRWSKINE